MTGQQAKLLRTKKGLTLRDLARLTGVSASTLSRFERGNLDITYSTVLAVFEVLQAPVRTESGGPVAYYSIEPLVHFQCTTPGCAKPYWTISAAPLDRPYTCPSCETRYTVFEPMPPLGG